MGNTPAPHFPRSFLCLAASVLATVLAGAGCSCGAESEAARFCDALAEMQCDQEIACGRTSEAYREQCLKSRLSRVCGNNVERVSRGFAQFDAQKAEQCLTQTRLRAKDCSPLLVSMAGVQPVGMPGTTVERPTCGPNYPSQPSPPEPGNACVDVFTAASMTGAGCFTTWDCEDPEEGCRRAKCDETGTCAAAGGVGEPCGHNGCDPGLVCNWLTNTCREPAPVGGECDQFALCDFETAYCDYTVERCVALPSAGEPCDIGRCSPGAYCRYEGSGSSMCVAAGKLNEACDGYGTCDRGLLCVVGTCRAPGNEGDACEFFLGCRDDLRCVDGVCAPRLGEHELCRRFLPYSYDEDGYENCIQCQLGLGCDRVFATCERPRWAAEGETCTDETAHCSGGQICRGAWVNPDGGPGTPGHCEPKQVGAACTYHLDCPPESFCNLAEDGGAGTCVLASEGNPCSSDQNCLAELRCDEVTRVCAPLRQEGGSCWPSWPGRDCAEGLTCEASASGSVCYRRRSLDESCDSSIPLSCLFPLACVEGKCQEAGDLGEACLPMEGCFEGYCTGFTDGHCELPTRAEGESCIAGWECVSGWCEAGVCQAGCR